MTRALLGGSRVSFVRPQHEGKEKKNQKNSSPKEEVEENVRRRMYCFHKWEVVTYRPPRWEEGFICQNLTQNPHVLGGEILLGEQMK